MDRYTQSPSENTKTHLKFTEFVPTWVGSVFSLFTAAAVRHCAMAIDKLHCHHCGNRTQT